MMPFEATTTAITNSDPNYLQQTALMEECAICEDASHGVHFGVNVCRACAAFFRRSTISDRNYQCRFGGGCQIGKDIRCSCRACRLAKCLKMGMDPNGVQRHRDHIGPRHKAKDASSKARVKKVPKANPDGIPDGGAATSPIESKPGYIITATTTPFQSTNNTNSPYTYANSSPSFFSSPICSPLSNINLLGSLRRNIEEIQNNPSDYAINKSYTTLTPASVLSASEDMSASRVMENVILTALRSASENSVSGSSGFGSLSSFNSQQQSPSSPALSLSSFNSTIPGTNPTVISSSPLGHLNAQSEWNHARLQQIQLQTSAFTPISNQSYTEAIRSSLEKQSPSTSFASIKSPASNSSSVISVPASTSGEDLTKSATPFITEMLKGYRKFLCLRKTASNLNEQGVALHKLFDNNEELIEGNYTDNVISLKNDLSLVSEMVNDHFSPLANFSTESKWILLRNFFCPFVMAERSNSSMKRFPDKDDFRGVKFSFMISSRHYADFKSIPNFFNVEHCKVEPNKMAKIFEPTFMHIHSLLGKPMRDLNISDEELLGLVGLIFWNDRVEGLSAEELKLVEQTQEALHSELYVICRRQAGANVSEGGVRFATICNLVHFGHKLAQELAASFSLANATNYFEIDTFLHNFNPQAW